ncbi:polymer-forming cytoskeletal protein [Pseudoduganella lutea]|uniref:DUF6701 domain-containing protein n=1 Tax=Pseudoduganella lutea TaxID=321985 RepID=A0A4P6L6Z5_9BURK|nr:polymer-forming cytoskeletal protein [Pseudoduganella lutea]QBE66662.1 hypothetical protein EWM63_29890 [Pseudoduganella lutea]
MTGWALAVQGVTPTPTAQAKIFNLPADINKVFSNLQYPCTASGSTYTCQGNPAIHNESILNITAPITLRIAGTLSVNAALFIRVPSQAKPFYFQVDGNVNTNAPMDISAEYFDVGGTFSTDRDVTITANIRVGAQMAIRSGTIVYGNVTAGSEINIEGDSIVYGTCTAPYGNYRPRCTGGPAPPASGLHHVRLVHTGSAATCAPAVITVRACSGADTSGSCTAFTGGVSGTVTGGGVSAPFTIASGSSSATASLAITSPTTVTLAATGFTASSSPVYTCWNGSAASCSMAFADSALLVTIPDHKAGTTVEFTIKAVRKSDKAGVCAPAFKGERQITFSCAYSNPRTGTKPLTGGPRGGPTGPLACGTGTSPAVDVDFDDTGSAPVTLSYADVGALTVTVTDAKLGISGTDTFVVAPYKFAFTKTPATTVPVLAGTPFAVNVAAQTSGGVATPNFGKETPAETVTIRTVVAKPTGGAAGETLNAVSTSVATGVATAAPSWTETGIATLTAALTSANYLQSAQVPAGATTGEVLYSIPDHYDVAVAPTEDRNAAVPKDAATTLPWWYARQPIANVTITALERGGRITTNFGKTVKTGSEGVVTLTAAPAATLAGHTVDASRFAAGTVPGVATLTPTYTFAAAQTAPAIVVFGAEGTGALDTNIAGATGRVNIRSGRLLFSRATAGSLATSASMPVTAQYWSGTSWVKNDDDSFTRLPAGSAAVSQNGAALAGAGNSNLLLADGSGYLTVTRQATGKAVLNVALNLGTGAGTADVSCLAIHPGSNGAGLPWLRSVYGDCGAQADPWAAVVFGTARPESQAVVHVREVYN